MTLKQFLKQKDKFLLYLSVEKNLSKNKQKAYGCDLKQFALFWKNLKDVDKKNLTFIICRSREAQELL